MTAVLKHLFYLTMGLSSLSYWYVNQQLASFFTLVMQ